MKILKTDYSLNIPDDILIEDVKDSSITLKTSTGDTYHLRERPDGSIHIQGSFKDLIISPLSGNVISIKSVDRF